MAQQVGNLCSIQVPPPVLLSNFPKEIDKSKYFSIFNFWMKSLKQQERAKKLKKKK